MYFVISSVNGFEKNTNDVMHSIFVIVLTEKYKRVPSCSTLNELVVYHYAFPCNVLAHFASP